MFELLNEHACFGGVQRFYQHASSAIGLPMRFSVYLPPGHQDGRRLPVLFYLAGLTCTEETFMVKAGAQRLAAELGMILVAPDTSPRGAGVPGETDSWDFGVGAGFYVDATQGEWARHYRMYSYILELREQVLAPLADLRPAQAEKLTETLRSWLLHQGRREEIAAELFVHPQTVRYRLGQLREAYGDRLEDPAWLLALTVALG